MGPGEVQVVAEQIGEAGAASGLAHTKPAVERDLDPVPGSHGPKVPLRASATNLYISLSSGAVHP
jgi:hypothetical protein